MAGKTYPLLAASLAAVFALSACSRDVKPAPEFKRTDYERVVVSNGVEPGTLDPQMSGDMAAGAIIRQLMDGLSVRMPKAKPFLLWRKNGRARASVFGPSICVMPNGAMAIRLLPKICIQLPPSCRSGNRRTFRQLFGRCPSGKCGRYIKWQSQA